MDEAAARAVLFVAAGSRFGQLLGLSQVRAPRAHGRARGRQASGRGMPAPDEEVGPEAVEEEALRRRLAAERATSPRVAPTHRAMHVGECRGQGVQSETVAMVSVWSFRRHPGPTIPSKDPVGMSRTGPRRR